MVEAEGVPRNAMSEVNATLASAEQDIKAATMTKIGGEREAFERECDTFTVELRGVVEACRPLLEYSDESYPAAEPSPAEPIASPALYSADAVGCEWCDEIQKTATVALERFRLHDGDSGWPFERIFTPELLAGCLRFWCWSTPIWPFTTRSATSKSSFSWWPRARSLRKFSF